MLSREDFTLTHEPGPIPDTEIIRLGFELRGMRLLDCRQTDLTPIEVRKLLEDELVQSGMDYLYEGVRAQLQDLFHVVMMNCGMGANHAVIEDAFTKVFNLVGYKA